MMTLTGLEAILLAGGVAFVSGLLTKAWTDSYMISRTECDQHRAACSPLMERLDKMEIMLESQCKLIRLLLSKVGIPIEEQLRLERDTLGGNGIVK